MGIGRSRDATTREAAAEQSSIVLEKESPAKTADIKYASYEEYLEHNPLGPEHANLATCPEDLVPGLVTHVAARHREHLLMEAGSTNGVALARETVRSAAPRNRLEEMLVEQLTTLHSTAMTMAAKAQHFALFIASWDPKARQQVSSIEAARMTAATARLMDTFQRGMLTLDRLQNGGRQTVVVKHLQQVQVGEGGQAIVTGKAKPGSRKGGGRCPK